MSLEFQNAQKIAELTRRFNELINNSKRIEDLDLLLDLDVSKKIPVGDGKAISVEQLLNQALSNSQNGVTQIDGSISIDENNLELTIPPIFWRYGGVDYSKQSPTIFQNEYAEEGKVRIDKYYATTENQVLRIVGPEGNEAIEPPLPINTVQITTVLVSDSEFGTPTPPFFGDLYVQKDQFKYSLIKAQGVVNNLQLKGNCILEIFATNLGLSTFPVTEINGFTFDMPISNGVYDGQDFYIKNGQITDILVKHNVGTLKALLFSNQDQVLKAGQTMHFKYISSIGKLVQIVTYTDQYWEVVSGALQNKDNSLNMLLRFLSQKGITVETAAGSPDWKVLRLLNNAIERFSLTQNGRLIADRIGAIDFIEAANGYTVGTGNFGRIRQVQFANSLGGNVRNLQFGSGVNNASSGGGMAEAEFESTDEETLNRPLRFTLKKELNVALADALAAYTAAINAASAASTANNNAFNAQQTANQALSRANNALGPIDKWSGSGAIPVTNTTAETLVRTIPLPTLTFLTDDQFEVFFRAACVGVNGTKTLRVRLGTSFSLANPIIASNPATAASLTVALERTYNIRNNVLICFAGNGPTDKVNSGNSFFTTPINNTDNWNLYVTIQLQNSSDSATLDMSRVYK